MKVTSPSNQQNVSKKKSKKLRSLATKSRISEVLNRAVLLVGAAAGKGKGKAAEGHSTGEKTRGGNGGDVPTSVCRFKTRERGGRGKK